MPKVSVIMSVYKEPECYIRQAIESILEQTFHDFEFLIVLDNPNGREQITVLREYEKKDSRIKILVNEINLGLAESLNRMLKIAAGEYIVRMDADDISENQRLEKQLQYMDRHCLDLVGCHICQIDEKGEIIDDTLVASYPDECVCKLIWYDDCIPHPSWVVKKDTYILLEGYRNIHACEDYDFLLRAAAKGVKMGICGVVLLNYRINTQGISKKYLFQQMLTAHFLRKKIKSKGDVTLDEIDAYLLKKIKLSESVKYKIAHKTLNQAIVMIKQKKIIGIFYTIKAVFQSKYILWNISTIIRMQSVKAKYRRMRRKGTGM